MNQKGGYDVIPLETKAQRILEARPGRVAFLIIANSANTDKVYVGFDNEVTASRYVCELAAKGYIMLDNYQGEIWVIPGASGQKISASEW